MEKDIIGKRFGNLVVKEFVERVKEADGHTRPLWLCECDCGELVNVKQQDLKRGRNACKKCTRKRASAKRLESGFTGEDLTGMQIGTLSVVGFSHRKRKPSGNIDAYWTCKCVVCGYESIVRGEALRRRSPKCKECESKARQETKAAKVSLSKDELRSRRLENNQRKAETKWIGKRFERLVVLSCAGRIPLSKKSDELCWLCRCDCGNEVVVRSCCLREGKTKSCGCYRRDMLIKQHEEAKPKRRYKDRIREHSIHIVEWKTCAYDLLAKIGFDRKDFDLHHIVPLGVGGSHSDIDNMILIPKDVHQSLPFHGTTEQMEEYSKGFNELLSAIRKKANKALGIEACLVDMPTLWLAANYPKEYIEMAYKRKVRRKKLDE